MPKWTPKGHRHRRIYGRPYVYISLHIHCFSISVVKRLVVDLGPLSVSRTRSWEEMDTEKDRIRTNWNQLASLYLSPHPTMWIFRDSGCFFPSVFEILNKFRGDARKGNPSLTKLTQDRLPVVGNTSPSSEVALLLLIAVDIISCDLTL